MIPIGFAWTSFGGSGNLNFFQNILLNLFSFPSYQLGFKGFSTILINAVFWSILFLICRLVIKKIENKKTAN